MGARSVWVQQHWSSIDLIISMAQLHTIAHAYVGVGPNRGRQGQSRCRGGWMGSEVCGGGGQGAYHDIYTNFGPQDIPHSLQVRNPAISMVFCSDFQKHSKTHQECLIKFSQIMQLQWCNSHVHTCSGGWETEITMFLLINALIWNSLGEWGHIIHHHWKGIFEENTAPLRSWLWEMAE